MECPLEQLFWPVGTAVLRLICVYVCVCVCMCLVPHSLRNKTEQELQWLQDHKVIEPV